MGEWCGELNLLPTAACAEGGCALRHESRFHLGKTGTVREVGARMRGVKMEYEKTDRYHKIMEREKRKKRKKRGVEEVHQKTRGVTAKSWGKDTIRPGPLAVSQSRLGKM